MKKVVHIQSVGYRSKRFTALRSMLTLVLLLLGFSPLSVPTFAFASNEKETNIQERNTQDAAAIAKTRKACESLAATGNTMPAQVVYARSTYYNKSERSADEDTKRGKTSTTLTVPAVKALGLNAVAVDPKVIPYGSLVITPCGQKFVAVDSGGDVIDRTAAKELASKKGLPRQSAEARAIVLDFYAYTQVGNAWDHFYVIQYRGQKPFKSLSLSAKKAWLIKLSNA